LSAQTSNGIDFHPKVLGVRKKPKKPRKPEKNNRKNQTVKKN
jgi:hypothetical protein